jgi:hypothetical protein
MLSYNCYNNGLEVYKEGFEKGHFFLVKENSDCIAARTF